MPIKRMKAWQYFIALDLATNESFENSGAFRSGILTLDAIVSVRLTQSLTAALDLRTWNFALWFHFNGKITHKRPPVWRQLLLPIAGRFNCRQSASSSMVPFAYYFGVPIGRR
jgi:hypothetical protein